MLQYPAPVVGEGTFAPALEKNRAFLEIVSVVLKIKFNFYQLICFYQMFNKI